MATLTLQGLSEDFLTSVERVSRSALGVSHLSGAVLVEAVARLSHVYTRERADLAELRGDDTALAARLRFFLPRDLLKVHGPLAELHSVGALPTRSVWRVLDLGAGLGSTSLGVARFAALTGSAAALDVTAIDLDPEALDIFGELARDLRSLPGVPIQLTTHTLDLREAHAALRARAAGDPFDLIVIGLALNEISAKGPVAATTALRAEELCRLRRLLAPDGAIIVLEPALRETSRALHAVRDQLAARAASPFVFAPCVRSAACPMLGRERDFCHERVPLTLPKTLAALAQAAGLRDEGLSYSYLTLTAAARSLAELGAGRSHVYRTVSAPLPSKGKLELWLCGEHDAPRAMRLDRHESERNAALSEASRGALLALDEAVIEARAEASRARIGADTQVTLLQSWRATRD